MPGAPEAPTEAAPLKIAIIGYTSSLHDAPWDDPTWEKWPVNNLHTLIPDLWPKATAWFNLHRWSESQPGALDGIREDTAHLDWVKEGHMPVYLFPEVIEAAAAEGHEFPTAVAFPRDALLDAFKGADLAGWRYFTNSVSWMIAYAIGRIEENGQGGEIALYGIDMAQQTEYGVQRPSCEYWLGVAEGAGINVTIAPKADLLKCAFLYGGDEGSDFIIKLDGRIAELEARGLDISNQWESLRSQMEISRYQQHEIAGALEDCRYWRTVWVQQAGNVRQGGADPYSTEVEGAP